MHELSGKETISSRTAYRDSGAFFCNCSSLFLRDKAKICTARCVGFAQGNNFVRIAEMVAMKCKRLCLFSLVSRFFRLGIGKEKGGLKQQVQTTSKNDSYAERCIFPFMRNLLPEFPAWSKA